MEILISDLSKTYEDRNRLIFDGLNARFDSGTSSAVLGKSGVGKSSLLNLIAGIDIPDRGEIVVGENRVSEMSDARRTRFRRRHIGFVFQSFHLISVLTVLENVSLVSRLDGKPLEQSRQEAIGLLEQMGLTDRLHEFPDRLSGGEQQRVALARALANDPEIILADEPTGNLDSVTGTRILDLLFSRVRDQGKTLVMVTHSRDAAARADRIFTVAEHRLRPESVP